MEMFQCISPGQDVSIMGDYNEDNQYILVFDFSKCKPGPGKKCYNETVRT
jgi:hypothetical protein